MKFGLHKWCKFRNITSTCLHFHSVRFLLLLMLELIHQLRWSLRCCWGNTLLLLLHCFCCHTWISLRDREVTSGGSRWAHKMAFYFPITYKALIELLTVSKKLWNFMWNCGDTSPVNIVSTIDTIFRMHWRVYEIETISSRCVPLSNFHSSL